MKLSSPAYGFLIFLLLKGGTPLPAQQIALPTDTLLPGIKAKISATTKSVINQGSLHVQEEGKQLKRLAEAQVDTLLQPVREATQWLQGKVNLFKRGGKIIHLNGFSAAVDYNYIYDSSGISTGLLQQTQAIGAYRANAGISIAQLPFDISIRGNNGIYDFDHTALSQFTQFNFNHKKYLERLQQAAMQKINPEILLNSILSRLNNIRLQYQKSLTTEIEKIRSEYTSLYKKELAVANGITDLSVTDMASLKSKLIPNSILEKYHAGKERYQELLKNPSSALSSGDSAINSALGEIRQFEALTKIYEKITVWKEKFENNSTVKILKSHLPFNSNSFTSFLRNPANLVKTIKNQANLGTLQSLFMHITKLNLGKNPLQEGSLSFQNILNNGIQTEFTGQKASAGFVYGSGNANINSFQQMGLNNFVSNEYSKLSGLKLGSGWNGNMKQSLSLNFFEFSASPEMLRTDNPALQAQYVSSPVRRDAVITWQSAFNISGNHKATIDLSKSFGGYRNSLATDSTINKINPYGDLFSASGKSNYAASIQYSGVLLKTSLEATVKKTGLGYNNPGSSLLRKGETRLSLTAAKKLIGKKISLKYKIDYRNQHFDPAKRYKHTNVSNQFQISYRINRNNYFGLNFQRSGYAFSNEGHASAKGFSHNLQANGSYLLKIKGKKLISNFTLGNQQLNVPASTGPSYRSKNWLFHHATTMVLKKNLLQASFLLNHSDNKAYYFNTSSVNAELSYSYSLGSTCTLNSGLGYYGNAGWNNQLGWKQQLSAILLKKITIDLDFSYKKAIKTIRTELANQFFFSSSIHYKF